jgi:hypothetical protein
MAQICTKCSNANPPDATYCYHDGALLGGHTAQRGAQNQGSALFPSQFVFPSGQVCNNFDQLATACQQSWGEAVDLLKQGFLASFLGGLGRADLARAAQEAARFPDLDRGLDQLLAKLPTQVVEPPKLKAEPGDVNVGIVPMGGDRTFELRLANQGMRLLYGAVASDSRWLTLGEAPGNAQKVFQFRDEADVPVQIRGQHLRAGPKPLEGQLLIDSNGGTAAVRVRLEVPIKPYPDGVLAGATTPRQVAEKAKAAPKVAAPLFESGAVARWFAANGWTYPVQGPPASGLGAVQQFFEALGLASAPKVEVAEKAIHLQGAVGQALHHSLEVRTPERRPVYAHATCDQPWLDVGRARLNGRVAFLPVIVPSVPNRPGETLRATVNVTANGNQRFAVPVTLTVAGGSPFAFTAAPEEPVLYGEPVAVAAEPVTAVAVGVPARAAAAVPVAALAEPVGPAESPAEPFAAFALGAVPAAPVAAPAYPSGAPAPGRLAVPHVQREGRPPWVHLLPAGLLLLALLVVIGKDLFLAPADGPPIDRDHPRIRLGFDYGKGKGIANTMSFGVLMLDPDDPKLPPTKMLTYDPIGRTNSTALRIDGNERVFGKSAGLWVVQPERAGKYGGKRAAWLFDDKIQVTQTVEVVPGEPQVEHGTYQRLLDTALVRYTIENKDVVPHKVGLRVLLDTLIGRNDGVPFTVPGLTGLVDDQRDFEGAQVPDFIQALEHPDLKDPGTVAQLNLRLGGQLEPPQRVSLTRWPGHDEKGTYDVPVVAMRDDSAVVIYWEEREMAPGSVREVGFEYGLGHLAAGSGQLGVTVGGAFAIGKELTVVGLVTAPQPGETLTLELPEQGLTLAGDTPATQPVPESAGAGRLSPVTWHLRADRADTYTIRVRSSTGVSQDRQITIRANPIF